MRFPRPPWGERPPPDERVDRPEVEAPRGAREPTGTNGPTLNNNPHQRVRVQQEQRTINCRNHYTNHDQPTPPTTHNVDTNKTRGDSVEHQSCGGHSTGETPSNIPNLEAKPGSADGTATDRLWESRTPPQHNQTREGLIQTGEALTVLYSAIRRLKGCQAAREGSIRQDTAGPVSHTITLGLHSYTRTIHAASLTTPSLAHCIGVHTRIGALRI